MDSTCGACRHSDMDHDLRSSGGATWLQCSRTGCHCKTDEVLAVEREWLGEDDPDGLAELDAWDLFGDAGL